MKRRDFIQTTAIAAAGAALFRSRPLRAQTIRGRPNVLLLITDQQRWDMLSCMSNRWLKTPAMDRLAASGMRFELAYATNPLCAPSRFSLQTGRMPSMVGIADNDDALVSARVSESVLESSLGRLFHRAGYNTVYGGKIHLPPAFRDEFAGGSTYRYVDENERAGLAQSCAAFLREPHEKPFFLTASLINPHDICFLAINAYRVAQGLAPFEVSTLTELLDQVRLRKDRAAFFAQECPLLPTNHAIPALEPEAIAQRYLKLEPFRDYVRKHWSEEDWRLHSWVYHRLTERVDSEVDVILTALREAGLERNTLVVLTSDHGEMGGAHKLEHKSVLYEEAMRVPFIVSYPGVIPAGRADGDHLVSTGLDLLPTLCDFAGIERPHVALDGRSVRALAEGASTKDWREYLVVESQHDRMVRTPQYKYCAYSTGAHHHQFNDLIADPGEMNNLAEDSAYRDLVRNHRSLLEQWEARTWDYDGMLHTNE